MNHNLILDLTGLKCPLPSLRTRKALKSMNAGQSITVTCTDPMAEIDIPNLVRETGDIMVAHDITNHQLVFTIRKLG